MNLAFFVTLVQAHQNDAVVIVGESGFIPGQVEVRQGTAILFENRGTEAHWPASDVHPTHEEYAGLDSKRPLAPGENWEFVFVDEGTWAMHDHLNPHFTFTVTVRPPGSEDTPLSPATSSTMESLAANTSAAVIPDDTDSVAGTDIRSEVVEFHQPPATDINTLYTEMQFDCPDSDRSCAAEVLRSITREYGPSAAIEILLRLINDKAVSRSVDEHQLSHEIGRQASESYGVSGDAFLLCPMTHFNGGCQHGFFEYVLGRTSTSTEAADLICGAFGEDYSTKFRFYCYHGVGHGVMMAQAYDLQGALNTCDGLDQELDRQGCWQGVFMENVNVGMKKIARSGVFSELDPLAPCNIVEEKYRWQCYINHAGYLVLFFKNDFGMAASACLLADERNRPACLQGLGLMTTNVSWQTRLAGTTDGKTGFKVALELCDQFPGSARGDCYMGALDNIMNYDEMNLQQRAIPFCESGEWDSESCFYQVGINIYRQVADIEERQALCESATLTFLDQCLRGAGLR